MNGVIAIAWMRHRRMVELCRRFDVPLFALETELKGVRRYWQHTFATLRLLREHKPRTLLVQNPSLVLTLLAVLVRPWFGYRLYVDAHNEAVTPFLFANQLGRRIARFLLRRADCSIVTNADLADIVGRTGGRPFVLCDPIPIVPAVEIARRSQKFQLTVVSTYEPDEPLGEIFAAARQLTDRAEFFVTGRDSKLASHLRSTLPANVSLTGFLNDTDYWTLLASSDAVIDLTLMDNCLVCGGYEGLAVGRPLILSDSPAARATFGEAAIYVKNDANSIAKAITDLIPHCGQMASRLPQLRRNFEIRWQQSAQRLMAELGSAAMMTAHATKPRSDSH